jgi:hypothetical protein
MSISLKTICEECDKEIRGRSDKRFCDDVCRNNFNRKKRLAEQIIIPEEALEVVRAIKKNYRLLKSLTEGEYTILDEHLPALLRKGFNPNYFTSIRHIDGELYRFCFECGFLITDDTIALIVREQQLNLRGDGIIFQER